MKTKMKMKHLQRHCFLFLLLFLRFASAADLSAANASEPVDLVEAVNRSCMSLALHEYYSNSSHRPKTQDTPCNSQDKIEEAASSGVFWQQGVTGSRYQLLNKTLKIGVPKRNGFNEFMKVESSSIDSRPNVTGFPIDVFNKVMQMLPYKVSYEFIPYEGNGDSPATYDSSGYYDSLISQVYFKKFDAVVGDTSITSNRSDFVDFTYEYMQAGISMIVPVRDDNTSSAWWFLEPLTTELWITTLIFSVLKGILVWFFEHGDNSDFQGSPLEVVGKVLYFSSSIFVFANSEKLKRNHSRFVVNIWMFLVFVLVTSYGANLTSMLTVERLQPTITDINQLKESGYHVGCQKGSFVSEKLLDMGFDKSKLKFYTKIEEYAEALSNGNDNNGVAAIVDEIPFIKVFLSNHCKDYTRTKWTLPTGGFSFVFPRGSVLVPDISRALLKLIEGEEMTRIEREWFGDQTTCPDSDSTVDSKRLPLYSLRSIFIIAGSSSAVALLIYLIQYFYRTQVSGLKERLMENGLWRSILAMGQYLRRTRSSTHRSRITPQEVTEVEFNTIEDAANDSCVVEMAHDPAQEEDQRARTEKEGAL